MKRLCRFPNLVRGFQPWSSVAHIDRKARLIPKRSPRSYRVGVPETRRIGVFGGTFDPPHNAHVVLAAAAVHQLDLDELVITPAGVPWQKVGSRVISAADVRLRLAEAAFGGVARTVVSDIETRRQGNSYTIDTLEELDAPDARLFLLLGGDAAAGLDTWERYEDVAALATIAVFPRRGYEGATPPPPFESVALDLPGLEVSSTNIRHRVAMGEPIIGLVPEPVRQLIESYELYGAEPIE